MLGQQRISTCALALLASLLLASQVYAGGLLDLFHRDKSDKSYVELANDLYEATPSSEFKDNVAVAIKLGSNRDLTKRSRSYYDLLTSFSLLENERIQNDEEDQLCRGFSLRTLRLFAEVMVSQGNLGPKKITEPIRRLNKIIVKQILRARATCFGYLARQWPTPCRPAKNSPRVYEKLGEVDGISRSLLLDGKPDFKAKELDRFVPNLQWLCYVVENEEVLKSYVDLLMASHVIDPESKKLAKLYEDPRERTVLEPIDHPNQGLLNDAYRFLACELFAAWEKSVKRN